jgi:hypothetical protein
MSETIFYDLAEASKFPRTHQSMGKLVEDDYDLFHFVRTNATREDNDVYSRVEFGTVRITWATLGGHPFTILDFLGDEGWEQVTIAEFYAAYKDVRDDVYREFLHEKSLRENGAF